MPFFARQVLPHRRIIEKRAHCFVRTGAMALKEFEKVDHERGLGLQ